jgi:ABC-type branched-subunit amino acid transport system ATPase component
VFLEVTDLSVSFAGLKALSGVSFGADAGTICALIGPNGAGKTTLFNAITGFVRPNSGSVRLAGTEICGQSIHAIARHGVRRTFQNGGAFAGMTVLENVLTGLGSAAHGDGIFSAALALPWARRREAERLARAHALLDAVGLTALVARRAGDLPSGQQRLVEIARAMAGEPRLLMLDEPAVGLSPEERVQLSRMLRRLAGSGVGIVLVEHVIDLVMAISDKIVVLNHGQKLAEGTPEQVRNNPLVLEAYLGRT